MKKKLVLNNYFFQFILIAVFDFALGGIVVFILNSFSLLPLDKFPTGADNSFIFYDNLFESFLAVSVISLFRKFYEKKDHAQIIHYFVVGSILYLSKSLFEFARLSYLQLPYTSKVIFGDVTGTILFRLNMVWAGLLVYFWTNKEEEKQHTLLLKEIALLQSNELKIKAELEALEAKINPHFLYNSLNSITNTIDDEPQKAKKMTFLLSKLFRLTINAQSRYYWKLGEELDLVKTYLDMEKIRFDTRLEYRITCNPSFSENIFVPRFLIQPLVENAIKHGISKIAGKGILGVSVFEEHEFIGIWVYDNGARFLPELQQGYGWRSVHEKMRLMGGEGATFEISNGAPVPGVDYHKVPSKYVAIRLLKMYNENNHSGR